MGRIISDAEYEKALKNNNNKSMMNAASNKFRNTLDDEQIKECQLKALWEALQCWKPKKRKFTSYLYQKVYWECIKLINLNKKSFKLPITKELGVSSEPSCLVDETLEILPDDLRNILEKRYIYGMTLREISEEYGCCHETIRKKITKAINICKKHENGV